MPPYSAVDAVNSMLVMNTPAHNPAAPRSVLIRLALLMTLAEIAALWGAVLALTG